VCNAAAEKEEVGSKCKHNLIKQTGNPKKLRTRTRRPLHAT